MVDMMNVKERLYVIVAKKRDDSGEETTPGFIRATYSQQALDRAAAYYRWNNHLVEQKTDYLLVGLNQFLCITATEVDEVPEGLKELSWAVR